MNLNPLGIGLTFWNNWKQDEEFILIDVGCKFLSRSEICIYAGALGFGFVLVWNFYRQ